jgi:hypothetical protein
MADGEQLSTTEAVTTAPPPALGAAMPDFDYAPDGVHLLRTTQQIQYQLSQMADQKASMLLGITFVIFTLTLGQSHVATPQPPQLILGGAAFLAATLTVFAVLPSVKPPADHGHNILFFGAFAGMSEGDYIRTLLTTAADPHAVHEAFARDIYQNGRVLSGKKYRLLGYAYRVLLVGLFSSVTAYVTPLVAQWVGLR